MQYILSPIDAKRHEGVLVFLYGDEVSDRSLPLSKKEIEVLREYRTADKESIVAFDRLPYRVYVVNFDSELPTSVSLEHLRRSAGKLRQRLLDDRLYDVAVTGEGLIPEEVIAFAEGITISDYSFDRYMSVTPPHIATLTVDSHLVNEEEWQINTHLWNRLFWCREWVNMPVADLNAVQFADELASIAADLGVTCTVFNKKQIESLRMGGLLAVNKGSVDEPRFVVLEYRPDNAVNQKPIALVGKGIMYDTGGLNIKPDEYMREMKSDMAGAATMASVLFAAADSHLPVHIVACLPMTDNRPGFNAYAADDIITMYDATTVEVVNTDAEGRLILADAIAYANATYNPELIVDMATLTGAAYRAVGPYAIVGMQQNAANPFNLLRIVGDQTYERVAELPFFDEYVDMIKSDVADIKNCGKPCAGAITAGKFLAHFAKTTPYIHLDIAGVAYFSEKQFYYGTGASGFGMSLMYAFLQTYDVLSKK
ncbi:MAG: leucyl aminopeptidase family protein [Bacteroidales bacterium]|nr:leucyl aminopeptidase family protein [Candidatus Colimorpha onthohippi]